MSKGDFNIDEDFYVQDGSSDTNLNDLEEKESIYAKDSDFSEVGTFYSDEVIDDVNVVYEENLHETNEDKVKYFLSTLNPRMLLLLGFIFLIIVFSLILIFVSIRKNNSLYNADVIIPDIVYAGEAMNINVINHAKGDAKDAIVKFSSDNSLVLSFANEELKGERVENPIIPIQEGKANITVVSTLGNRVLSKKSKEVVVCPAFDSSLIFGKNVSVVKGKSYSLGIDFGSSVCSKDVTYESSDSDVMTVHDGAIKGVGVGKAILTVKKGNRYFSKTVYVTEKFVDLSDFDVSPNKIQLVAGQVERLKVSFAPFNGTFFRPYFDSSDEEVAVVNDNGVIKALKAGEVTIKVASSYKTYVEEVKVVVYDNNTSSVNVTSINVEKDDYTVTLGKSFKINYSLLPENASNKSVSFNSSDNDIVTVNENGVVYAKGVGKANVVLKTSTGISKKINIEVVAIKAPVISSSDGIASGKWHNKAYTLNFSGSDSGMTYYYGYTDDSIKNKANKVKLDKDGISTYYVKACMGSVCSKTVSYVSKVDVVKPTIVAVAGIESVNMSEDSVQIAIRDNTSLVSKWCVTLDDNTSNCKWKSISPIASPIVTYTVKSNDTYYAFAKDVAGNVSDGYRFVITNIE